MTKDWHSPDEELAQHEGENLSDALERAAGVSSPDGSAEVASSQCRDGDGARGEGAVDQANKFAGSVKQKWGDVTDDERLQTEGTRQKLEAEAKASRPGADLGH